MHRQRSAFESVISYGADDYHDHLRFVQEDAGFTKHDTKDMSRMGKKQELKVKGTLCIQLQSLIKI